MRSWRIYCNLMDFWTKKTPTLPIRFSYQFLQQSGFFSHVVVFFFHIARVFFRKPWQFAQPGIHELWEYGYPSWCFILLSCFIFGKDFGLSWLCFEASLVASTVNGFTWMVDDEWRRLKIATRFHQQRCDSRGITSVSIHLAGASPKLLNPGQKKHTHNTRFMYVPWS